MCACGLPHSRKKISTRRPPCCLRRGHAVSFARTGNSPRVVVGPSPSIMRARGTPDARCVRSLACKSETAHEHSHHENTGCVRRSARDGFNGLLRVYPRCSTLGLNHRSRGLIRRVSPSVRGERFGAAPWRKAMRRDNATWAVRSRCGRQPGQQKRPGALLRRARSIARASNTVRVHRIPPRVRDDRETPLK